MKSADHSLSRIQALFLDAVGPLSGVLDAVNKGSEISIDYVEGAVKAALTFLPNFSNTTGMINKDNYRLSNTTGAVTTAVA